MDYQLTGGRGGGPRTWESALRWLSQPGEVSGWLDLASGIRMGRGPDGRVCQTGVIRAAMMVIDDPSAKAEDNPGGKGNDRPDGKPMTTARDYYDYFAGDAGAFIRASSYGLADIEVTLVSAPCASGVFRLSGYNAHTYPAKRGGNVNAYVEEALQLAAGSLRAAGNRFDVLYIVAVENFEAISYGPTDVRGDKLRAIGLENYGALVRIGQDSYLKFKKKAFVHELGHDLGLPDLYVDDEGVRRDAFDGGLDAFPCVGRWGMMSWINSPSHDFLGWEKWQLGWITREQVAMVLETGTTAHSLTATSVPGGVKLVVIPGPKAGTAYVAEYKRAAGVEVAPIKEAGKPGLEYEGLLIYRVDAANPTMHSPITVVNLFPAQSPQQQTETMGDALARSTLGPRSGIFAFEDPAAGVRFAIEPCPALPSRPEAPFTVTVSRFAPDEQTSRPVLSDGAFLDLETLECRTSFDLRGIHRRAVRVEKAGRPVAPVRLDAVTAHTLRVRLPKGTLTTREDMEGITLGTRAFSFYGPGEPVAVAPARVAPGPVLQATEAGPDRIALRADRSLEGCTAGDFCLIRRDGSHVPPAAYQVAADPDGLGVRLSAARPGGFQTVVAVQARMRSSYDPESCGKTQMYFGARENGIVLRGPSPLLLLQQA